MKLISSIIILLWTLIINIVYSQSDAAPPTFDDLESAFVNVSDAVQQLDLAILTTPLTLINALAINKEAKNLTTQLTNGVTILQTFGSTTKLSDADGQTALQTLQTVERRVNPTVIDLIGIGPELEKLQITFIAKDDVTQIANVTESFIVTLVDNVMPDSTLPEAKKLARRVNHSLFVANSYFGLLPNSTTSTSASGSRMKQFLFLKALLM